MSSMRCTTFPIVGDVEDKPYSRKESNFEHEVIEAVIDTHYRRLVEGRSINISLGGIPTMVVQSAVDQMEPASCAL